MLDVITSLYADWRRGRRTGPGSEAATRAASDVSEAADVKRTDGGATTTDAVGERTDTTTSWRDLLDGEPVSKQAVKMEFGIQPHEFLVWLVRDAGGRMWQSDLVETTGWSKSTVSRYLGTLESTDTVKRVQIGRRKLVGVPGGMPDIVPMASSHTPKVDEPA